MTSLGAGAGENVSQVERKIGILNSTLGKKQIAVLTIHPPTAIFFQFDLFKRFPS